MRKWWLLGALLLGACVFQPPDEALTDEPVEQIRFFDTFDKVKVDGPFDVDLHTGYRNSNVEIRTIASRLPQIKAEVINNTLRVTCIQDCSENIRTLLRINTHQLHSFWYRGHGEIIGKQLSTSALNLKIHNSGNTVLGGYLGLGRVEILGGGHVTLTGVNSSHLELIIKGKSKVQLAGKIRLGGLTLENGSWVSLYWIKADKLKLRVHGKTVIQMAGITRILDLELWGRSEFRGRYLKASETFVKTHDHSIAEISTINHQHTLATDASDIYFYRIPDTKANFMAYEGSVLDMKLFDPKLRYALYDAFNL